MMKMIVNCLHNSSKTKCMVAEVLLVVAVWVEEWVVVQTNLRYVQQMKGKWSHC